MIDKIKDWIFFESGVQVSKKIIQIFLVLMMGTFCMAIYFFISSMSSSGKVIIPNDSSIETNPHLPPRLKNK